MHSDNWDDLRFVLAVVESGSVSAASRVLGVNHATVLRRVTAFETAHGAEIFERTPQGYQLRPDRAHVIEAAREAALALGRIGHMLRADGLGHGDVIRVTSTDTLCTTVMARVLPEIAQTMAPHRLCLMSNNAHLDMARLQADVAVRPAVRQPPEMEGEHAADLGFAAYATRVDQDRWLGLAGALHRSAPARWLADAIPASHITHSADSFLALREMARRGQGVAILPCIVGDETPELMRVEAGFPAMSVPLWVLCHRDLVGAARMRLCVATIAKALRANRAALIGTAV